MAHVLDKDAAFRTQTSGFYSKIFVISYPVTSGFPLMQKTWVSNFTPPLGSHLCSLLTNRHVNASPTAAAPHGSEDIASQGRTDLIVPTGRQEWAGIWSVEWSVET